MAEGNQLIPEVKLPFSLTATLNMLPEPWGIKNLESRFVYANPALVKLYGVKSPADIEGKLDHEIASKLAELDDAAIEFTKQDKKVIESKSSLATLELHPKSVDHPFILRKTPFINENNECVGIIGYDRRLEVYTLSDYIKGHAPGSFLLNKPDDFFTERECEIISLRFQGMTCKKIADILSLKKRTIQNYMNELYSKTGVNHSDDFREFCEKRNYHRYIPKKFISSRSIALD